MYGVWDFLPDYGTADETGFWGNDHTPGHAELEQLRMAPDRSEGQ